MPVHQVSADRHRTFSTAQCTLIRVAPWRRATPTQVEMIRVPATPDSVPMCAGRSWTTHRTRRPRGDHRRGRDRRLRLFTNALRHGSPLGDGTIRALEGPLRGRRDRGLDGGDDPMPTRRRGRCGAQRSRPASHCPGARVGSPMTSWGAPCGPRSHWTESPARHPRRDRVAPWVRHHVVNASSASPHQVALAPYVARPFGVWRTSLSGWRSARSSRRHGDHPLGTLVGDCPREVTVATVLPTSGGAALCRWCRPRRHPVGCLVR